jgi:hypothetical protein
MASRTVALRPQNINETVMEASTSEVITPGHLVDFTTAALLRKHTVAGGLAAARFAIEQDYVGDGIDTAYAAGEFAKYINFPAGSEVNALVAAGAAAIVIGDPLESAGNGTLRKQAAPGASDSVIGVAKIAVDNSGGGAAVRVIVEII